MTPDSVCQCASGGRMLSLILSTPDGLWWPFHFLSSLDTWSRLLFGVLAVNSIILYFLFSS